MRKLLRIWKKNEVRQNVAEEQLFSIFNTLYSIRVVHTCNNSSRYLKCLDYRWKLIENKASYGAFRDFLVLLCAFTAFASLIFKFLFVREIFPGINKDWQEILVFLCHFVKMGLYLYSLQIVGKMFYAIPIIILVIIGLWIKLVLSFEEYIAKAICIIAWSCYFWTIILFVSHNQNRVKTFYGAKYH